MRNYGNRKTTRGNITLFWEILLLFSLSSCCTPVDFFEGPCSAVFLHYRYVPILHDEYRSAIIQEKHFLFDENGYFLKEIKGKENQRQKLYIPNLSIGKYQILTLGNYTPLRTNLSSFHLHQTKLSEVMLSLKSLDGKEDTYAPAEELYWNLQSFEIKEGEISHYICDMEDIHCRLYIKIVWEDIPPKGSEDYTIELGNLEPAYNMTINRDYTLPIYGEPNIEGELDLSTSSYVVHHFPYFSSVKRCKIQKKAMLRGDELYCKIVSLRYLNEMIPSLQIYHEGRALFRSPLDLTSLFHDWGWFPSLQPTQEYRLSLQLQRNGLIKLEPLDKASVLDWENGGDIDL